MWFNIIPPYVIILGAIAGPGYALWWSHYFFLGNHYRRGNHSRWDRVMYSRDWRLTGNPYVVNGLKELPDK
ncbi:uncharacterized protein LOC123867711 [Maniola jurtina]|uniref:uncharacterized protein LOC123867711 n=1 Tax=Maniola jurtina TaxID=191418 RepID=UPI001E68DEE9|nr:uncharacterized protein LOC123867711 [Maniola jurtina]